MKFTGFQELLATLLGNNDDTFMVGCKLTQANAQEYDSRSCMHLGQKVSINVPRTLVSMRSLINAEKGSI